MPRSSRPLTPHLTRPPSALMKRFRQLKTARDVAELLELDWSQLHYITSRAKAKYVYRTYTIPKKQGGVRVIQAPHPSVRILQRKLLRVLELVYKPHPAAHGFVRGLSIGSNAARHVNRRFVLNLDLKDFFPTITFPRVRGLFMKRCGVPGAAATVLARLCCNTGDTPDHLAQGAPTSPMISNMICHSLDHQFVVLAKETQGLYYTRYADDITFSTNRKTFPLSIASVQNGEVKALGDDVLKVVADNHFSPNYRKVRIHHRDRRQEVTGLTVNKRVNLPRAFYRELRGMLHAWHQYGYVNAEATYHATYDRLGKQPEFRKVVAGKLAYLRQIRSADDRLFRRLYDWARTLDPEFFKPLPPLNLAASSLREAAESFPSISPSDSKTLRRDYLKRMFASGSGIMWLIDPNLRTVVVQDLCDAVDPAKVSAVRLLSQDKPKGKQMAEFNSCKTELANMSVPLEWRILTGNIFHDRWLIDDRDCVIMGGPFANIYQPKPPFGQNRTTRRPEQISYWWNKGVPLL